MSKHCHHLKFLKKRSNQKRWTFKKETMNQYSQAERAKYCKKDSRYPPLCTKREATSKIFKRKRSPSQARQDVWCSRLHLSGSCCSKDETRCFEERFLKPPNYIDVQRQTQTIIDALQAVTIDDYWNLDGDMSLSQLCFGVTRFALLNTNPPERYVRVQGRLTKKQATTRPRRVWPEEWSNMSKGSHREATKEWAEAKPGSWEHKYRIAKNSNHEEYGNDS